jgi:hypothetical protein
MLPRPTISAASAATAEPARSAATSSRMSVRLIKIDDSSKDMLGISVKRGTGAGDASD